MYSCTFKIFLLLTISHVKLQIKHHSDCTKLYSAYYCQRMSSLQFAYIHKTFKTKVMTNPQQQYFP